MIATALRGIKESELCGCMAPQYCTSRNLLTIYRRVTVIKKERKKKDN